MADKYVQKSKIFAQMMFFGFRAPDMTVTEFVDDLPVADVQEVKHARFISELVKNPDWKGRLQDYYQPNSCSNCHTALYGNEKYCWNCGAKMDEQVN